MEDRVLFFTLELDHSQARERIQEMLYLDIDGIGDRRQVETLIPCKQLNPVELKGV